MDNDKLIKNIKSLIAFFVICFFTIIAYLTYFNIYLSQKIVRDSSNPRIKLSENEVIRGSILDRNGKKLAYSKRIKNIQKRYYVDGEVFGNLIGYNSYKYGKTGVELLYDDVLRGNTFYYDFLGSIFRNFVQSFEGEKRGSNVFLTIDYDLQKKAYAIFKDDIGAAVAINPKTGEILAIVSKPSFNPENIDEDFEKYKKDVVGNPFLNRAIQGFYPPGSTFKIVTATSYLENNLSSNEKFNCTGELKIGDYILRDFNRERHGKIKLEKAFEVSCNYTFGTIGTILGYNKLNKTAEKFMFNKEIDINGLTTKKSSYRLENEKNKALVAQSAIGQHGVATNPLHMALVASVIANEGKMMKPYIVKEIKDDYGVVLEKTESEILSRVTKKEISDLIKNYMVNVVEKGTGKRAKIYGINVAGKTGTAEIPNSDETHSWFVGFAPAENPKIAVAVVVEKGGVGGKRAAEIARYIIESYLK